MSENNTQKIITDVIFKSAIEKILTEISDYIYVEEPYTKPEIDDMFDATSQEIDYYSSLISDVVSENRLWSSKKISEEIAKSILESNEYSDNLISNLSSINLKYVESLPDTGDSSTIYILKSASEADPDTLNLFDGTQWVTIGNFEIDMANYVTTDAMNTALSDKANDSEVVKVDDILTSTTGASNNNVLSASATVTELYKKVNKTDIVDNLTSTDTDKPLSAKQGKALDDKKLNKADADKIIIINAEGVNIKDFILENCTDENKTYYITARSSCTDIPKVNANYFMTVEKVGSFTIKVTAKELAGNNNEYVCTYRIDNVKWTNWEKVCTTSVTDVPNTDIHVTNTDIQIGDGNGYIRYFVKNGICYVSIYNVSTKSTGAHLVSNSLPKPLNGNINSGNLSSTVGEHCGFMYINSDTLLWVATQIQDIGFYGSFSYPVAES